MSYLKIFFLYKNELCQIIKQTPTGKKLIGAFLKIKEEIPTPNGDIKIFYELKARMDTPFIELKKNDFLNCHYFYEFDRYILKRGDQTILKTIYDELPSIISSCPVCLEETTLKTGLYSCSHSFCVSCYYKWSNLTCPICRNKNLLLR